MDRTNGAPNRRPRWREMLGPTSRLAAVPAFLGGDSDQPGPARVRESNMVRSQAARGESSPRRYVGRAGAAGVPASSRRSGVQPPPAPLEKSGSAGAVTAAPWSLRLIIAVSFVCLLALAIRVPGITTAPVDVSTGVESTHAAFASVLAGGVSGALETVKYYPPTAPWHGLAPVNPTDGLPLFGWLSAFLLQL